MTGEGEALRRSSCVRVCMYVYRDAEQINGAEWYVEDLCWVTHTHAHAHTHTHTHTQTHTCILSTTA